MNFCQPWIQASVDPRYLKHEVSLNVHSQRISCSCSRKLRFLWTSRLFKSCFVPWKNSKQLCLYVRWIEDEVHEENLLSFPPAIDNSSSPVLASLCPPERDKGEKKAAPRYNEIWVSFSLDGSTNSCSRRRWGGGRGPPLIRTARQRFSWRHWSEELRKLGVQRTQIRDPTHHL